jgi:hypothetical protein
LIGPIAIDAPKTLHVSPHALAMTVSIACCAAYVTPVNMLVMEPGGHAFGDYVKVGLPLLFLTMLVTIGLVALDLSCLGGVGLTVMVGTTCQRTDLNPLASPTANPANTVTAIRWMRFSISSTSSS